MDTKRRVFKRHAFFKMHPQIVLTVLDSIVQHNEEGGGAGMSCYGSEPLTLTSVAATP